MRISDWSSDVCSSDLPPPAAPALAGGEAARRLPGTRFGRPVAPGQARGAAARDRRRALPAAADRLVDQRAEGRGPAPAAPATRPRRRLAGRDAEGLRAVPGALRPRRAGGFRRAAAARARTVARQPGAAGALPPPLRRDPGGPIGSAHV